MTEFEGPEIDNEQEKIAESERAEKKSSVAALYKSLTSENRDAPPSDEELSDYYVAISELETSDMLDIYDMVGGEFDSFRDFFEHASKANLRQAKKEFDLGGQNNIQENIYADFDEHGIRYKGHYREVFVSPDYIEPVGSSELREKYGAMAQKALDKLTNIGVITKDQSNAVSDIWDKAVVLDDEGMKHLIEQSQAFDSLVQKQFGILDDGGAHSDELKKMKANMALSSYKYSELSDGSPGFVLKRQAYMQLKDDSGKPVEQVLFINKKYLDSDAPKLDERWFAYEETAHLISKLNLYPEINRPWVEEMLAKTTVISLMDDEEIPQGVDMDRLHYNEYQKVYQAIEAYSKTQGLLRKVLFEEYDRNSDEYKRVSDAINGFNMVGTLVDMGLSVEESLKYIEKISESEE